MVIATEINHDVIMRGLKIELEHHVFEAEFPEEYEPEVTAEIECLRLIGENECADEWLEAFEAAKADRPLL